MTDELFSTLVLRIPGPLSLGPNTKSFLPLVAVVAFDVFAIIYYNLNQNELRSSHIINHNHKMMSCMSQIRSYVSVVKIIVSTAWVFRHRSLIPSILGNIQIFQRSVSIIKSSLVVYFQEICIVYLVLVLYNLFMSFWEMKDPVKLSINVSFTINMSFTLGLCGQLSNLLRYLGSFYDNLLACKKCEFTVQSYYLLSNTFEDTWQLFKLPILLITVWSFGSTIAHIYLFLYYQLLNQEKNLGEKLVNIAATYFLCFPVLLIIRSSIDINTKAKKFTEKLYWKMVQDKSSVLLNNELLDLHFIASEEPVFTACGFFTLDYSLICSMISAITTYLVIVLQFEQVDENTAKPLETTMFNTT